MTVLTADERHRRGRAAALAAAVDANQLAAVRIPDPTRAEEVRLSHELAVLRDELAEARGEDADAYLERLRLDREFAGLEEYVDDDGHVRLRDASAFGAADGSEFSRYSGGLVEMAVPDDDVDEDLEPAGPNAAALTAEFIAMLGT